MAVLAALAVSFTAYGGQSLTRAWTLMKDVETLEREVSALRAETARLTADVDRLRTDPDYIEEIAREKLGMVKPGERVLKLPPASGSR
jgi:cell division protein FtsB